MTLFMIIHFEYSSHTSEWLQAVPRACSVKRVFLDIWQNSQENTYARVSIYIKLQTSGLQLY